MARKTPKYLKDGYTEDKQVYLKNKLEAKTLNQKHYIKSVYKNDITFCDGPAGSGKTHIAAACAAEFMKKGIVDKIVITRPVMSAGEDIGFLPGTADRKLQPYMLPVFDELNYYVSRQQISSWKNEGALEVAPIGFMRGRSFHNAFIIGDECQNLSMEQMKMFLTRMGKNSKLIVTGDTSQSDLPSFKKGAFGSCLDKLDGLEKVGVVYLRKEDIVRNSIIPSIIERLEE